MENVGLRNVLLACRQRIDGIVCFFIAPVMMSCAAASEWSPSVNCSAHRQWHFLLLVLLVPLVQPSGPLVICDILNSYLLSDRTGPVRMASENASVCLMFLFAILKSRGHNLQVVANILLFSWLHDSTVFKRLFTS